MQAGELIPADLEVPRFGYQFAHLLDSERAREPWVGLGPARPQPDVGVPTFVAGPRPAHQAERRPLRCARQRRSDRRPTVRWLLDGRRYTHGRHVHHVSVRKDDSVLHDACGHERGPVDARRRPGRGWRSEEHTSELQSHVNLVCRLLLEKKKKKKKKHKKIKKKKKKKKKKTKKKQKMNPKRQKQNKSKYETEIHESKGTKPRN